MTKILVLSDSHGNKNLLEQIIKQEQYDVVFYLGDGIRDLDYIEIEKPIYKVAGNCDWFSFEPIQDFLSIENIKILIAHGHQYHVKNGLSEILSEAKRKQYNLVCYGHTHTQKCTTLDDIIFINPGSVGVGCYAVMEIQDSKINFELKKLEN